MCYIKGTGAGRIGKFMLLKGNKVTMTLKRDRDGNICKGVFGGEKNTACVLKPENGYRQFISVFIFSAFVDRTVTKGSGRVMIQWRGCI